MRKGTRNFIISFIILCGVAFLGVFLFFKSSQMQNRQIREEMEAYRDMRGRNELLNIKLDTIYTKMSRMSDENIENDMFLRKSVFEDIQTAHTMIAQDSVSDLRQITILLNQMTPMLKYKNELSKKKIEERAAYRFLKDCMGNDGRVTEVIRKKYKPKGKLY